jgi:hypothetical protein
MNPVFLGIPTDKAHAPTLKAARRMKNLSAGLHEISRRPVGIDKIPYEAFLDPIGHMRWNPNLLNAHPDLNPLKTVQESLIHPYLPDASEAIRVKGRDLERGTVANRIVERAITTKLNSSLDRYFNSRSFGYRPGRSPEMAILQVRQAVRRGFHWALKTDITHFFQSIDRHILENQLSETIVDQGLRDTIMAAVSPVVVTKSGPLQRLNGLPGGIGLSPFLSNVYLHEFDESCSRFEYFRYADDIVVLGTSWDAVVSARRAIRDSLESIGLQLNHKKTFIRDLHRGSVVFLGYELRGGYIYPPEKSIRRFHANLELRGLRDRKGLMMGFVRRYRIGTVRKLFRRLDRQLGHLYPPGLTLVSLLEESVVSKWMGARNRVFTVITQLDTSCGQGCSFPVEKTLPGRPPHPVQQGAATPYGSAASALKECPQKGPNPDMKNSTYLNFIRSRPCTFCGNPCTDPHHAIRNLRGISEAGLAQKGSDYLTIPACRRHHDKLHAGHLQISREDLLEIIITNLICYLDENKALLHSQNAAGGAGVGTATR